MSRVYCATARNNYRGSSDMATENLSTRGLNPAECTVFQALSKCCSQFNSQLSVGSIGLSLFGGRLADFRQHSHRGAFAVRANEN